MANFNIVGRKKITSKYKWTKKVVFRVAVFCWICLIVFQYFGPTLLVDILKTDRTEPVLARSNVFKFVEHLNIGPKIANICDGRNFLVYTCNEACGGWGDRQKGIVSSFLLALMSNRSFVIDLHVPCDISGFLNPNTYDWTECLQYVKNVHRNNTETIIIGKRASSIEALEETDFLQAWNKTVIFLEISSFELIMKMLRSNPYTENQISWLKEFTNPEVLHLVLKFLFMPKSKMLSHFNNFSEEFIQGRQLVCGHLRVGQNPSNPFDDDLTGTNNKYVLVNNIFPFLKQFKDSAKYVVYLATDSDEVRKNATSVIPNYINLNRTIVHVDKYSYVNKSEACEGLYTALFEQYILTKCDYLVLTRSNFGVNAAYIRGHSRGLYILHRTKIHPATLSYIQTVYKFQ
ncbi:hypothetical protein ACF0H5_012949 [Mactra antiquata]